MPRRKQRARHLPPSISDQRLARAPEGKLFTEDGLKARYTERVGAMAPDTDPPEPSERPARHPRAHPVR